jgi:hypothetical protein
MPLSCAPTTADLAWSYAPTARMAYWFAWSWTPQVLQRGLRGGEHAAEHRAVHVRVLQELARAVVRVGEEAPDAGGAVCNVVLQKLARHCVCFTVGAFYSSPAMIGAAYCAPW